MDEVQRLTALPRVNPGVDDNRPLLRAAEEGRWPVVAHLAGLRSVAISSHATLLRVACKAAQAGALAALEALLQLEMGDITRHTSLTSLTSSLPRAADAGAAVPAWRENNVLLAGVIGGHLPVVQRLMRDERIDVRERLRGW